MKRIGRAAGILPRGQVRPAMSTAFGKPITVVRPLICSACRHGESPVAEEEVLNDEQRAREALVFGLRRLEGVDRTEFASAHGTRSRRARGETIAIRQLGMLADDGDRVRLTREGLLVSDSLWPELL